MATKAELQAEHERCEQIRRGVFALETSREFPRAVTQAEAALPHQHASVSFQRRFLKTPHLTTPAVDVILRYAPAFFLGKSLDAVQTWYDSGTKTERTALPDMPERIETARKVLAHAIELWGVLAEHPSAVLRPPATPLTKSVVPVWLSAGLIAQRAQDTATFARVSDGRREAVTKCSGCGSERTAPLAQLLEPTTCHGCKKRCAFVLTRRVLA